ncbi:class II glutamine amidotransferase [Hydrogenoanaerobacterium sp.]|uniref:class II glutamine amidotransferase n=1 Tax=Hydrogenoanaerobacterium sp. TaxID=2953763 RepID=UPI0028A1FDE0|nr:class II glutamine amidotransferase [Hydrogenoanaerobacterium sp.]
MCSLFGIIDYEGYLNQRQKSRILKVLSKECEVRGTDATGFAYVSQGKLQIRKAPLPAHKMSFSFPADVHIIMGHTRMATQGNAKNIANNHPFRGYIGGREFALAHNGVIWNDRPLRRQHNLSKTEIETDSYIAVQLLEQNKALTFQSLGNMAEEVEGSFTFTVLDEQSSLYFIKGDSPLALYHYPNQGYYLYASTDDILQKALAKLGMKKSKYDKLTLTCVLYEFAGNIGVLEADIDLLLGYGYTEGEIEELLCDPPSLEYLLDEIKGTEQSGRDSFWM